MLKNKEINFALSLLILGIIIRALYQLKYNVMLFQHDWQGHVEMIKYFSNTWSIPLPGKGLEFPQQPLYYIITAGIYSLSTSLGFSDASSLEIIGYFSFVCSVVFLIYGYKFIALLTQDKWIQSVAMLFLALTPSLVYLSARINNDALVMVLSSLSLYYLVKSYQNQFKYFFYRSLVFITLLFLTKISTFGIEILFFILLIMVYRETENSELPFIRQRLYLFGLVGVFIASYTLWRVYLPVDGVFHMVNSGRYPNQTLPTLDVTYFLNTHFKELLELGQSYVFGEDSVRHSFITYQYGTMFFGEFDYAFFTNKTPWIKGMMQMVLLLGSIFIFGFLLYIINIYRVSGIKKILFIPLFINFVLILKFMSDFPSVCNTDFRYFVSSFILFAFVFAQGLAYITALQTVKKIVNSFLILLFISELLFFIGLIF